ncbi:MAG: site-specific integrase, partial [Xanthomonadales bacterium]|nr:site-specific integrase [Xanthomonadales bacterium]
MPKLSEIRFNENTAKSSRPREKVYELRDSGLQGLILRVQPTGKKVWRVALDRSTKRHVGDASVMTLDKARGFAKKKQADFAEGKKIDSKRNPSPTLEKFLKGKYLDFAKANQKTGDQNVARLLSCCEPLLNTRLDKLHELQLEKWKASRLKTAKPATVKRDLAGLKTALNKAVSWGIIESNPAGAGRDSITVKTPDDKRVRYLADDERKGLLGALIARDKQMARARQSGNVHSIARGRETRPAIEGYADHLTPLVLLTMNTGLRRGEVLSLKWDQVHLEDNPRVTIRAGYAKSNKTRHVPLNSEALAVMKKWKGQGSGEGWVFPNPVTGSKIDKLKSSWPNLMAAAKIENFRFHDLRHDFASRLVMAGVDLYRVKDLCGHGSI